MLIIWPNGFIIIYLYMFNKKNHTTMKYQTLFNTLHAGDFVYLIGDNPTEQVHVSYHEKAVPDTAIKAGYSFYDVGTLVAHAETIQKAVYTFDQAIASGYTVKN